MDGNKFENSFSSASILKYKFPQNFLAGAGVLTAGAGGEITGVCTALTWSFLHRIYVDDVDLFLKGLICSVMS